MRFAKGHGTENDFVILLDPDGAHGLTPGLTRRLCDRRAGIGGDGVLRAVRTGANGAGASAGPGAQSGPLAQSGPGAQSGPPPRPGPGAQYGPPPRPGPGAQSGPPP